MLYGNEFNVNSNYCHNSISFLKSEWYRVGGYTDNYVHEDVDFHDKLEVVLDQDPTNIDFCYNFGGLNYHLSSNTENRQAHHESIEDIAYQQLQDLNLVGKKFWIEPDFEQYNNFMLLDKIFKEKQQPLLIKHIGDAKIDISHLL
jgi:hypothetical protein